MLRCPGPVIRINPDEIHVEDKNWLDTLYVGPAHVSLCPRLQWHLSCSQGVRDKYPPAAYLTGTPTGSEFDTRPRIWTH